VVEVLLRNGMDASDHITLRYRPLPRLSRTKVSHRPLSQRLRTLLDVVVWMGAIGVLRTRCWNSRLLMVWTKSFIFLK
jgi:hypothetical protein